MSDEQTTSIEVVPQAPITLFGTDDPALVVERASTVATALADVLKRRNLVKRISTREYVLLEGWTLLGSMLGVFAQVEWTRPVDSGWEARAVVKTLAGATVGSAEAMCSRSERTWASRDDYALRSMAQTRALAKALRMPLGFIVELAGYAATPADEMPDEDAPQAHQTAQEPPRQRVTLTDLRQRVAEIAEQHGADPDAVLGKPLDSASVEELITAGKAIASGVWDIPFEQEQPAVSADVGGPRLGGDGPESSSVPAAPSSGRQEVAGTPSPPGSPPAEPTPDDLQLVLAASGGTLEQPESAAPPGGVDPVLAGEAAGDSGPSPVSPARAEARAVRERLRTR